MDSLEKNSWGIFLLVVRLVAASSENRKLECCVNAVSSWHHTWACNSVRCGITASSGGRRATATGRCMEKLRRDAAWPLRLIFV